VAVEERCSCGGSGLGFGEVTGSAVGSKVC
jgi:hypothetical protein